jgi:hypothetical protein
MTVTTTDESQLIDRDVLASALRAAAACWTGPRRDGRDPRAVAEDIISWQVQDQPKRGSAWLGDNEPGLTADQAHSAVRDWVARSVPPECASQAAQDVIAALEGTLVAPEHDNEPALAPGASYLPACAHCGQRFRPKNRAQKNCSRRCRQQKYEQGKKARQADGAVT